MKIQLKRSNQLENGLAKEPTSAQMEYGEIAVNYNTEDPSLFIKDSDDNIVKLKIAESASVLISSTAPDPATTEIGTLWWNSSDDSGQLFILYDDPSGGAGGDLGGPKWIEASPNGGAVSEDDAVLKNPDGGAAQTVSGQLKVDSETSIPLIGQRSGAADDTGVVLRINNPSGTSTATIAGNGDATFAGDVVTGISDRFTDGAGGTLSKGAVRVQRGSGAGASSNFFEGYYGVSSPGTKDSMTARIGMDGSAEFSGTITAGNYDINSDAGEGSRILPSGLIRAQRPSSADGSSLEVFSGFWGQETTSKIFANGSAVFANDVRIADDPAIGSSTSGIKFYSSGLIRIKHEQAATSPMIYDNNGSGNTTFNIRSGGQILLSDTDASGAATSSIFLDGQVGSGTFMNFANADLGNRYGVKIYKEGSAGQERGQVHLDCTNASITSAKVLRIRRGSTVTWSVTASGTVGTRGIELELEPDNPANYVSTMVDGEETQVYSGPTLDVKERLQNLIARIDAIEANEVIDDATDSTLLLAIQALTQRLDERDAIIADLQARITTLEA